MHTRRFRIVTLIVATGLLTGGAAHAKLTPAQKCAVAKEKATARLIAAKTKCFKKTQLDAADPACLEKATAQFAKAFAKAEKPDACLDPGDVAAAEARVDAMLDALVQALRPAARAGSPTPVEKCANAKFTAAAKYAMSSVECRTQSLSTGSEGLLASCRQKAANKMHGAFATAEAAGGCFTVNDADKIQYLIELNVIVTLQMFLPPAATPTPTQVPTGTRPPTPTPRFVDNGNGTITDHRTGLMWEKKDDAGGIHDKDNTYSLEVPCIDRPCDPAGTAFTVFLATLNTPPCFAGHCDWRLPTSAGSGGNPTGQAAELESILAAQYPNCTSSPCAAAVFQSNCPPGCSGTSCSCTIPYFYWSSSEGSAGPSGAWGVSFDDGYVAYGNVQGDLFVRAVR